MRELSRTLPLRRSGPGYGVLLQALVSGDERAGRAHAGDHGADERVAAFVMELSGRYAGRGFSATRFHLSMSRGDNANCLRLAAETVSRMLTRFRSQGLIQIQIEGRELELLDPLGLCGLGQCLLPE